MSIKTPKCSKANKQTSAVVANRASHVLREGKELLDMDVFSNRMRQFIFNAMKVAGSALGQKESHGGHKTTT